MKSIEEILNGSPAETKAETSTPEREAAAEAVSRADDRDDTAPIEAKGETGAKNNAAGPPPADEDEPADIHGLKQALRATRKKLQDQTSKFDLRNKEAEDYQKRLKDYEARVAQTAPAHPQVNPQAVLPQQQAKPDFWLDPDGYLSQRDAQLKHESFLKFTDLGVRMFRAQHPDYDENEKIFIEEAQKDPSLHSRLMQSEFPAEFAYEQGRRLRGLREIGDDPLAFKAKVEAEITERLEAKYRGQHAEPSSLKKPVSPPPTSLAGVTSIAPRDASKVFTGPKPLSEILK